MKYICWGAARQVTGSMHLLELDSGQRILVDCGLDYEKNQDADPNIRFPFEPTSIDFVILTHAHIDHSGNIPNLVKQGFKGEIFCTEPTSFLLDKLWADSVNIQNKDRKKRKGVAKIYGYKDVSDAMSQLLTLDFERPFELGGGLKLSFYPAGHILGAASALLEIEEGGRTKRIGFSGDLGNYGSKLIVDPVPMQRLDVLVCESTYGNRTHKVQRPAEEELMEYVQNTCVKQEGKLIIPAFSVGRTQAILFTLNKLFRTGQLPAIRVFADSPLALASTNIHQRFQSYLNEEAQDSLAHGNELFDFKELHLIESEEEVEEMDLYRGSSIVVSSAGMLEGGRIQSHISENIENPLCTILIAGFCSPGTLGAQLLQRPSVARVRGRDRYVYAKIEQTDVFSAHPDRHGLIRYLKESSSNNSPLILLVHGEEEAMLEFSDEIRGELGLEVEVPTKGQVFDI